MYISNKFYAVDCLITNQLNRIDQAHSWGGPLEQTKQYNFHQKGDQVFFISGSKSTNIFLIKNIALITGVNKQKMSQCKYGQWQIFVFFILLFGRHFTCKTGMCFFQIHDKMFMAGIISRNEYSVICNFKNESKDLIILSSRY